MAAIAAGPTGAYALTYRVFGDLEDQAAVWKMTEMFGYLKHLRVAGTIARDEAADGTFSYRLAG
jgi:hypothetical protein